MSHADLLANLETIPGTIKSGGGRKVRCPVHDDRQPSLSVDVTDDGTILLSCMVGCRTEDIVTALGATMADLFPARQNGRPVLHIARKPAAVGQRTFQARYTDGEIAGLHHRTDDGAGTKRIWWEPRGVELKRLALYLSWELPDKDPVVVVEGERATLAVRTAGLSAVGSYGTSAMPSPEALALLVGRDVVLWPDHDDAGVSHMAAIAEALRPITVRTVRPPTDAPKGWDAADTDADSIRRLVAAATSGSGLRFRTAREIVAALPAAIEWCWDTFLAYGTIAELDGRPKRAGKTTLIAHLISAIADGRMFLDRMTSSSPVVLLTEQPLASLREVLERARLAERDDISILPWHDSREVKWPTVVGAAVEECRAIGARLLVVDTLPQFARIRGDAENDAGAALEAMAPVQAAAADHGLAVLVTRHERKGGGDVGESGRGSSAFAGSVDVIIQLRRPEEATRTTIRSLTSLSRFDETPDELLIELTEVGYVVLEGQKVTAFDRVRDLVQRILADGLPRTKADIFAALDILGDTTKSTRRDSALASLVEGREVARDGRGVKGDPHLFRLLGAVSLNLPHSSKDRLEETGKFSPNPIPPVGGMGENESNGGTEDDPIPPTVVVGESAVIECQDYVRHQSAHRRAGSSWICDICIAGKAS